MCRWLPPIRKEHEVVDVEALDPLACGIDVGDVLVLFQDEPVERLHACVLVDEPAAVVHGGEEGDDAVNRARPVPVLGLEEDGIS